MQELIIMLAESEKFYSIQRKEAGNSNRLKIEKRNLNMYKKDKIRGRHIHFLYDELTPPMIGICC